MAKARVNYRAIIEAIFFDHYRKRTAAFEFERSEIEQTASRLNVEVPDNLGDVEPLAEPLDGRDFGAGLR